MPCTGTMVDEYKPLIGPHSIKCLMFTAQSAGDPPLPWAQKYLKDPLTQLGSSLCISHSSLPHGLHCLGHVIACCLCKACPEQERSIFHLGGYRGDLHLSGGLSAAKQGQTCSRQVRKTPTTPDRQQVVSDLCACV